MLARSRRLVGSLLPRTVKQRTVPVLKARVWSSKGAAYRKILLGCGLMLSLGFVSAIEDETIRNTRAIMNRQISELRSEYGQTTIYPDISYDLKGDNYEIKFLIDQRKCDLFALLSHFMSTYNTEKQFKVIDMKAFTKDDLITFYVEF